MPNHIDKPFSERDANQTCQLSYNDVDATISTNGFLVGKVGNQITLAISTTTLAGDTETYSFFDGLVPLYQIQVIYTSGSRETMISATRIS